MGQTTILNIDFIQFTELHLERERQREKKKMGQKLNKQEI